MSPISLFNELKLSKDFTQKLESVVGLFSLIWLFFQACFWLLLFALDFITYLISGLSLVLGGGSQPHYINLASLMSGFTLFSFFPFWLQFVCFTYIAVAVISIPFTVLVYIRYS